MIALLFGDDPTQPVLLPNVLHPKKLSTCPASREAQEVQPSLLPPLICAERTSLQAAHDADRADSMEVQFKHSDGLSCPKPYAYPAPEAPCPDDSRPLAFRRAEDVRPVPLAVCPSRAAGRVGTPSFAMIVAAADRARPRGVRLEVRARHYPSG